MKYIHLTLQGFKEDLKNNISKFRRPPKLDDKLLTGNARAEKL